MRTYSQNQSTEEHISHMTDITAIVLTHNESKHLRRCLTALQKVASRVCVVDSFSNDDTEQIARDMGADFYQNPWKNYATQFSWGLQNCDITSTWVMRIDADEYPEPKLVESIKAFVQNPAENNSAYFKRKIIFLGQPITHGFFYPALMLRLWKNGQGAIEQRWMDEHIVVQNARTITLDGDLADENLNDLTWWTHKHTGYAMREVYDIVQSEHEAASHQNLHGQASFKRFLKNRVYNKLPGGLRGGLYFFYRYVLGRGFLDGKAGFYFHFLQAFWYRAFVDAKLYELTREAKLANKTPYALLCERGVL
jgi:glycosyltransferase involved in cell wall biosynthesis